MAQTFTLTITLKSFDIMENNLKKEAGCIALPTDKVSASVQMLAKGFVSNQWRYCNVSRDIGEPVQPHHLYFFNDMPDIGDWIICAGADGDGPGELLKYTGQELGVAKVVATTNKEFWDKREYGHPYMNGTATFKGTITGIAKISESFVQAFVEAEGKIDKVMLGYIQKPKKITDCKTCDGSGIYDECDCMISKCSCCYSELTLSQREDAKWKNYELDLTPQGQVKTYPIKERMYSRAELFEAFSHFAFSGTNAQPYNDKELEEMFNQKYPE